MYVNKYDTIVANLYSLILLFSGQLPDVRPIFVPKIEWDRLENLYRDRTLVRIISVEKQCIELFIPEWYDIIIHSRCVYGSKLIKYTSSINSRFRWWSGTRKKIVEFLPEMDIIVKNKKFKDFYIRRTIKLPEFVMQHFYIKKLYEIENEHHIMLKQISRYLLTLIQGFIYTKIYCIPDSSNIFDVLHRKTIYNSRISENFWEENKRETINILDDKGIELFF